MGTVHGSVLGPNLCSLFVSPLLDLAEITLVPDDNYILVWNKHRRELIIKMKTKLVIIRNWLRDSVLKINESKTKLCLFHRKNLTPPPN